MDCKGRLVSCGLLPLSLRREILDTTFLFKYRQGRHALDHSDFANEFHPMRRARRSDKEPIYTLPLCKIEIFAISFFNHVVHRDGSRGSGKKKNRELPLLS